MKFTDEELSRILSAHANGELRRDGYRDELPPKVCVNQAAFGADPECTSIWNDERPGTGAAAAWFDDNYNAGWPLGKFLRELEKQGLA